MKETGIKDKNGIMICEGDRVKFNRSEQVLVVTWVGDGDDMDWAADKPNGEPDSWLDSSSEIVK